MFKPGDVVECVDASASGSVLLREGDIYEVAEATSKHVYLKKQPDIGWMPRRFKLTTPAVSFRRVLQYSTDGKTWLPVPECP